MQALSDKRITIEGEAVKSAVPSIFNGSCNLYIYSSADEFHVKFVTPDDVTAKASVPI